MSMSADLFTAILAMDAYNRGYRESFLLVTFPRSS